MSIPSGNFRGVTLTGDDARAFEAQIRDQSPNERGRETLARGLELLRMTNTYRPQGEGR